MTSAEARFSNSLRPRKPEGSLGRTAQDVHLDSHIAPELWTLSTMFTYLRTYRQLEQFTALKSAAGTFGIADCGCGLWTLS